MTAGVVVCCMPTTAVVLGHLKNRVSSSLAKSRKPFSSFFASNPIGRHKTLDSTSTLRTPYGDYSSREKGEKEYDMQKPWSGSEDVWKDGRGERDKTAAISFEDASICGSTKTEVTQDSDLYLLASCIRK